MVRSRHDQLNGGVKTSRVDRGTTNKLCLGSNDGVEKEGGDRGRYTGTPLSSRDRTGGNTGVTTFGVVGVTETC